MDHAVPELFFSGTLGADFPFSKRPMIVEVESAWGDFGARAVRAGELA
jgi:hypothetical protein